MERQFAAGGVVYKQLKKNLKLKIVWLVTKSTPSAEFPKGFWRLPKGWLDDEDNGKSPGLLARGDKKVTQSELESGALREVEEEGGVCAKIVTKIGTEKYFLTLHDQKILKFVTFYLMEWARDLPEGFGSETEEVVWLPFEQARKKLTHPTEKRVLDRANLLVTSGTQPDLI